MRVIVCGSRDWPDPFGASIGIYERIAKLPADAVIVHGGARGADAMAGSAATQLGMRVETHYARWDDQGKAAGVIRNRKMAELGADLCIAFWDGSSRGTKHMIKTAQEYGIPVEVIRP